jgi:hypothetical protein
MNEDPYRLLATEIVVVLLKDYRRADSQHRVSLRSCPAPDAIWVNYCCLALGITSEQLIAGLTDQMNDIDAQ